MLKEEERLEAGEEGEAVWTEKQSEVAKYNKIVRNGKHHQLLPKKVKNLLEEIYNYVDDATKKKLLQL